MQNFFGAIGRWYDRRTARFNRPGALRHAAWLAPLLFGALSLLLGQDNNWDLRNYHLYNAYALLNGRIGFDLSPGQWQSYFNPTLDLLYYGLNRALPAPLAGFAMGALHGLNFVLVLAIARLLLPAPDAADRHRLPLLLALAGTLGAGFLSELGNSMGDNMIALFVLASLYLVLRHWPRWRALDRGAVGWLALSGLVMGLGTGLKLTNATFALALCMALLTMGGSWWQRLRLSLVYGVAVLAGLAATAGHWFLRMWQTFGNPLFPQMNDLFRSPLALPVGVADTAHLPHGLAEALLWPFIFTLDGHRVSELVMRQLIWPVVYLLFIALALRLVAGRLRSAPAPASAPASAADADGRTRFVLVFFALGYVGWLKLFGIYRYLVPLELLAPLAVWLLLQRLCKPALARRAGAWVLTLCAIVVFPFSTWGHSGWTANGFSADDPGLPDPAHSLVYTAHGDPPMGWMATLLPPQVPVVALAGGFPESPAYLERIRAIAASRSGTHYVMLIGAANHEEITLEKKNLLVSWLGQTGSDAGCARLERMMKKVRFHVGVEMLAQPDGPRCRLELLPPYRMDLAARNLEVQQKAAQDLQRYGLHVRLDTCRVHRAAIGNEPYPYQLCEVGP
ncbi:glycosyltransferase 87 family protein [Rugamonas rivuli]|nr:glycosyltransferase 87 family protein [Rugamonas rivuli]